MLTSAQLAALKADIGAQSSLTASVAAKDWVTVAAFYNSPSSPAVTIWRADVQPSEIVAAIIGSEFVALTAIKQSLLTLLLMPGVVDATSANIRADFSAIFASGSSLTALTAIAQRTATRIEALFTTSQVSAAYGYVVTTGDVQGLFV